MAHDVFISYSSKDKLTADAACAILEQNGIRCWIAPRDILPGTTWAGSIIGAINASRVMVLVFSGHCNLSPQIEREVERAINKGIPLVPMRIEDVLPGAALEFFLSAGHWLDAFTKPIEQHFGRLVTVVEALLAGLDNPQQADARAASGASVTEAVPLTPRHDNFSIKKATAMIIAGQAPPEVWRPFIKELHITDIGLRSLMPLAGLAELRKLELWHTPVSDLRPIAGLTALKSLKLWDTQISDLSPIASLTALESLELKESHVSDLTPLAGLTAIRRLGLEQTQVTDLSSIAGLTGLKSLDLFKTPVSDLRPISTLMALESLSLWCTLINDLAPIAELVSLRYLNISSTLVSNLSPIAKLVALVSLELRATPVRDLTPIAGLTNLEDIDLEGTKVSNLRPLVGLANLRRLDISRTQVSKLRPLVRWLVALKQLDSGLMKASDASILQHIPELKIIRR